MWYRNFCGNSSQNSRVNSTAFDKNKSMNLKPLNDNDFKGMVNDYLIKKEKILSDEEINTVIKKAHEIDKRKTRSRPLVLLFVADAVADGKEAKNWDLNKLVEHVIKRYENHWKNVICKGDEELFKAVKEITAYVTAVGGWDLRNKKIGEPIKSSIDLFLKKVDDKNLFLRSICEKDKSDGIWSPFEPDLIGEFFVLEFLRNKIENYDEDYVSNFSKLCWTKGENFWWFLYRCAQNYRKQKIFKTIFANDMEIFVPQDEKNVMYYSYILVNMTFYQTLESTSRIVKKLEILSKKYSNNQDIKISYAKGLYNLSCKQDLEERKKTVLILENLWESSHSNREIQTAYARGLFSLGNHQDLEEREKTILILKNLWESTADNREVLTLYANGLFNLSCNQELKEMENTIVKLEELWKLNLENQEVRTAYVNGLVNLSIKQELSEIEDTIDKLKNLESKYPKNFNIQKSYAVSIIVKALKKAEFYKTKESIESEIAEIEKYAEEHKDNEELQKIYNQFLDDLNKLLS